MKRVLGVTLCCKRAAQYYINQDNMLHTKSNMSDAVIKLMLMSMVVQHCTLQMFFPNKTSASTAFRPAQQNLGQHLPFG